MKRLLSITGGLLGLLALGALAVALALTFGGLRTDVKPASQAFQSPIETPTQPPYPPPATPTPPGPPATPTVAPTPVPRCTFAARPAPAEPGIPLEAYHFSDPQVVLTHTGAIGIASWLPDSQQLLITVDIPGTNRNSIDIFTVRTGELSTYAERDGYNGKPVWLQALRAVAYAAFAEQRLELWISHGDPQQVERVVPNVWGLSLAVEPDGRHLWYFSRSNIDRPQRLNAETGAIEALPLDLAPLRYPKYPEPWQGVGKQSIFKMAWQPGGSQVVLYAQPWTFLFDTRTNQVCELDLGQAREEGIDIPLWALEAQWSPNGRYLAFITTDSTSAPIRRMELTILDMEGGERRTLSPGPDIEPGRHYVTDIAWAPNGQIIAIRAAVKEEEGIMYEGLYLVEATNGQSNRILPETVFTGGDAGWSLHWSPDGRQLVLNCPTRNEGRLCLMTMATQGNEGR